MQHCHVLAQRRPEIFNFGTCFSFAGENKFLKEIMQFLFYDLYGHALAQ